MALTFIEVKDRLKQIPEEILMELLGITSEDLVERFTDFIENNIEELEKEVE